LRSKPFGLNKTGTIVPLLWRRFGRFCAASRASDKQKRPRLLRRPLVIALDDLELFGGRSAAAAAAACRFFLLRLFVGFLDQRFAGKANLVALDRKHF